MKHGGKQFINVQVTEEFKLRMWQIADTTGLSLSDIARMTMERGLRAMEAEPQHPLRAF